MNTQRIDDLELKFMAQEQLLEELNEIVAKQQKVIDALVKNLQSNNQKSQTEEQPSQSLFEQLKDERPPHY